MKESRPAMDYPAQEERVEKKHAEEATADVDVEPTGALLYYSSQWSYPPDAWRDAVRAHFEGAGDVGGLDFRCYDPGDHSSAGDVNDVHFALV